MVLYLTTYSRLTDVDYTIQRQKFEWLQNVFPEIAQLLSPNDVQMYSIDTHIVHKKTSLTEE
jgi:hypothetical protein